MPCLQRARREANHAQRTCAAQRRAIVTEYHGVDLPDLFTFSDGRRVRSAADWPARRQELLRLILEIQYGLLPPPALVRGALRLQQAAPQGGGARRMRYLLTMGTEPSLQLPLELRVPAGEGPFPLVLNGDACWGGPSDDIAREVLRRGYILAVFDRTVMAPDAADPGRSQGLYAAYPQGNFGALSAWAWGYHRCVDFLSTLDLVDATHIAITGHSRGGKCVLLAGATDERIALTAPNDSGCSGAGCYRWQGPKSETLADIVSRFPFWFAPSLAEFVGRESELPFDQHSLKALVAPRPLLSTEALGDLWANPSGTWLTHLAAREAYRWLGMEQRIGIWYREGGHGHTLGDWSTLLDYADWRFYGKQTTTPFDVNHYPDLPPAFSWSGPV